MDKGTLRAIRIVVKGRVQGVGFRYWTRSLAKSLKVKGWVRNLADYSVEIFAEADTETLGEFVYALKHEHPYARVESLNSEEVRVRGYKDFIIEN
ncbi:MULTISPECIES: acylphosphatase [unclassified Treponema]|uniref:acylphosphatase n=1 Tax=unclassified Treponema TaxID=2638727 RepID=UPI0020A295A2|nr:MULTISPECIES: acylphosphatase [unclassified Treponema]UTC67270.1 acylphosphatase [Treponema sp. OMZ 789]UTC69998.1 acylphosphatase [Treponema sp. OMZ 790]UTC72713.1 acylphosphatase [Treponema sp. OMZ 791]